MTRRDSSFPTPNHEQIYYKKDAHFGDQWIEKSGGFPDTLFFSIIDTAQTLVFGKTITIKLMNINNGEGGLLDDDQIWTEEF